MKRESAPLEEAISGPISNVAADATEADQRELLASIEHLRHLGRLERENAIMKRTIRRSQYYLALTLQPKGLSAKECIIGLLQTLDGEEIDAIVHR